jgi:hypothetical protein
MQAPALTDLYLNDPCVHSPIIQAEESDKAAQGLTPSQISILDFITAAWIPTQVRGLYSVITCMRREGYR